MRSITAVLKDSLYANAPFLVIVLFYISVWTVGSLLVSGSVVVDPISRSLFRYTAAFCVVGYLATALGSIAYNLPDRPILFLIHKTRKDLGHLCYGAPIILIIPSFFSVFGQIKGGMHSIVPFYADEGAAWIDRLIFGMDAWQFLHPLVGYPAITAFLDYAYGFWFLVMYGAILVAAFLVRDEQLRTQFLLTYLGCWILLGNLAALAFNSVGPCYVQHFYGSSQFEPLMAYLEQVNKTQPLGAVAGHSYLLNQFVSGTLGIGKGISAVPSLHVAMSVLIAIFAFRLSALLGIAASAFAAVIMVASVALGWHYAVDGLISLAAVPFIWLGAGRFAAWYHGSERRFSYQAAGAAAL